MTDLAKLNALYRAAQQACEEGESTLDFEAAFADLLDFILATPACRQAASDLFVRQVRGAGGCIELLEYCMHELRWAEVLDAAKDRLHAADDWRVKSSMASIVGAFEEEWPDTDMYRRWRK